MQVIDAKEARAAVVEALNPQMETTRTIDPAEIKVKSSSDVKDLSGSILMKCKEHGYVKLRAIGDHAIGVASRAATIASGHLYTQGIEMIMRGFFWEIQVESPNSLKQDDTGRRTGFTLVLEPR